MTGSQSSVGFVSVDVHGSGELLADSYDDIAKSKGTTVGIDLDGNYLLIGNAELDSFLGGEVDVSFCNDDTLGYLDLAAGTNYLASGGTGNISGLTDRRNKTYLAGISERKLDLCGASLRSENGDSGKLALGTYDGNSFLTGKLTGLRKVFFLGKCMVRSEKDGELFLGYVNVTGRSFNKYFHGFTSKNR